MEPDDQAAHGVAQVERLLRTIGADPTAPRLVAVTGPGGSGKSLALRSVQTLYARGGDSAPLIVDDVHVLGDDAVRRIVDAAHLPGAQVTVAFRPWPVERGLGELRELIGELGTTVCLDPLDRDQVAARARHRLGRDLDGAAVDALTACTGGVLCLVDAVLDGADGVGPHPWERPGVLASWDPVRRLARVGEADAPAAAGRRAGHVPGRAGRSRLGDRGARAWSHRDREGPPARARQRARVPGRVGGPRRA